MTDLFNTEEKPYPLPPGFKDRRHNTYGIVIYLPQSLDELVASIRERFDPLYRSVSSHITLVFPFETHRPLDELASLIRAETERQRSILVELESIGDFYPESPVIFWKVKDISELRDLYVRLYARLQLPIPHKNFIPHVTVAREISNHRVVIVKEKIAPYLPQEKFYASAVDLVTPLVNERWVSVRTFPFAGLSPNPLVG